MSAHGRCVAGGMTGSGIRLRKKRPNQRRGGPGPEHDHVAGFRRIEAHPQLVHGESRHEAQDRADGRRDRHAPREGPGADVLRQEVADPGVPRRAGDGTERGGDDQEAEQRRSPGAGGHGKWNEENPDPGEPGEAGGPPADGLPHPPALDERDRRELENLGGGSECREEADAGVGGAEQEGESDEEGAAQERVAHLRADAVALERAESSTQPVVVNVRNGIPESHGQ